MILNLALPCGVSRMAAAEKPVSDLQRYLGHSRVLLVFAPRADDPSLLRQRAILADAGPGVGERDLVSVEVIGDDPIGDDLRRSFRATADHFRAVLVGKDGNAKLSTAEPFQVIQLFEVIDAMPMRRRELRARRPYAR